MSTQALDALHRVSREVGVLPEGTADHVATGICREFHRLRSELIALEQGLERANKRLDILEGTIP